MEVYRITVCDYINDLSGYGAFVNGGRWNSEGLHALYTASTASLALLETLVHLKVLPKSGFCLACIRIPDNALLTMDAKNLPQDWGQFPAPLTLQQIGDRFIKEAKYLGLQLPSAVLQEDKVILLNPKHPQYKSVTIVYSRPMDIDKRLTK